jgi:hypothetical protein
VLVAGLQGAFERQLDPEFVSLPRDLGSASAGGWHCPREVGLQKCSQLLFRTVAHPSQLW